MELWPGFAVMAIVAIMPIVQGPKKYRILGIAALILALGLMIGDFMRGNSSLKLSKPRIAKIQIKEFEGALQMYVLDTGKLPEGSQGLVALVQNVENLDAWNGPYLAIELPTDPWGRDYVYVYPGNYGEYDIYSFGPDGLKGTEDDVCNWKK